MPGVHEVKQAREPAARCTPTTERYREPDKSGLTFNARPGKNDFNIPLK